MRGPARKSLAVQTSHYSIVSLFGLVAGLVSFPLLTRIFSIEDYGVMALIGSSLSVLVTLGKVGVQHSILRYHSEISAGKSRYTLAQLYSTTLAGMGASALIVMLGLVVATRLMPVHWLGDARLRGIFAIVSFLVLVQVIESAFVNVLRAQQRTALFMKYGVAKKYVGLGLTLGAVLLVARTLVAFYSASVVSEVLAAGALAYALFFNGTRTRPSASQFSWPLYVELLGFGLPMMVGYELSGIVLAVGDRYVIQGILGEAPLGLYAAGYNLCQYVQALMIASVGQAIMPIYMDMFDRKGAAETSAFISRSLRTYVLLGAPVVAGLAAVGPELIPSLASKKYASASIILPWVIAGMVVDGTNSMLGSGLFIHRKTRSIMYIVLSCAVLNIVLNLVLVPRIGIVGSAVATLVSYVATALGLAMGGRRLLPVTIPWSTIARASLVALTMYAIVCRVYPGHRLITVGVRGALGASFYVMLIASIDVDARALVRSALGRFRPRRGT